MTQPSEGQRKQQQRAALLEIQRQLTQRDWFAVDDEFRFLVYLIDGMLDALTRGE